MRAPLTTPQIYSVSLPTYAPRCKLTAVHHPQHRISAWLLRTCPTRAQHRFLRLNYPSRSQNLYHILQFRNLDLRSHLRLIFQPFYSLYWPRHNPNTSPHISHNCLHNTHGKRHPSFPRARKTQERCAKRPQKKECWRSRHCASSQPLRRRER